MQVTHPRACRRETGARDVAGAFALAVAVEFGAPDYPNFLSRPGLVACDWQYPSLRHACPTPDFPPKPPKAEPAATLTVKANVKKS